MDTEDCIDKEEVYDIIRHIKDPEHPNTLEELEVVHTRGITVDEKSKNVRVDFTPTIPGCGMATLIGLVAGIVYFLATGEGDPSALRAPSWISTIIDRFNRWIG